MSEFKDGDRGLHNWRNLFKKPTGSQVIIFIMLLLGILMAMQYKAETQICRDTIAMLPVISCQICETYMNISRLNQEYSDEMNKTSDFLKNFTLLNNLSRR